MQSHIAATPIGYGRVAKVLHWLVAVLLAAQFALGWVMPDVHRGTKPEGLIFWHVSIGMLLLAVVVIRFVWRLVEPVPLLTGGMPPWQVAVARLTHWLLYAVLVVQLVLGWANASARGWVVDLFGVVPMPWIMPSGSRAGMQAGDIHGTVAWVVLALVGLHVAAALYHQFIRRDNLLQRMW